MFFARETLEFPVELDEALQRLASKKPGAALRALWPKLAQKRGQAQEGQQHYSFRREEAEAYAAYYLPVNCLKVPLVLEEARLLGVEQPELDWLDFGTGPGTAFWGLAWWCARRKKKLRFTGWDQSPVFLGIARDLAAGEPFGARAEFIAGEDPVTLIKKRKPSAVSFVNSIAEIFPDPSRRLEDVRKIYFALKDLERQDGRTRTLLIVEPGSRESSRELAALKDALEAPILLPCLDARPCGALANPNDWCHEEARVEFPEWVNELGQEAGLRKEAVLFSYALIRTSADPAWSLGGASRIVSQRMERKGQVECRICTTSGKLPARVQRSKATPESEFLFQAVRGDLWRSVELGEKGDVARADVIAPPATEFGAM